MWVCDLERDGGAVPVPGSPFGIPFWEQGRCNLSMITLGLLSFKKQSLGKVRGVRRLARTVSVTVAGWLPGKPERATHLLVPLSVAIGGRLLCSPEVALLVRPGLQRQCRGPEPAGFWSDAGQSLGMRGAWLPPQHFAQPGWKAQS